MHGTTIKVKRVFVSCVKSFDMEQRAVNKFYFKSGKTATELYQEQKQKKVRP